MHIKSNHKKLQIKKLGSRKNVWQRYCKMKKFTLNDAINKQLADPDFATAYERELLINAIAKMVVNLRKHQHLTQNELAQKVKTSQTAIARLESGIDSRVPSLDLLARIAAASDAKLNISFIYS